MIVPMKRLTLIGLKSDEDALFQALQAIGAVQILPPEEGRESELLPQLENRVQRLNGAQLSLKPYAEKKGMGPKPEATAEELAGALAESLELCERVEALERPIAANRAEAEKRLALAAQLKPWAGLECGIEAIRSTPNVKYLAGFLPEVQIPLLEGAGALVEVYGGEKDKAALIACAMEDYPAVSEAIKGTAFKEYAFPALTGTPAANIAALEAQAQELVKKADELQAELTQLGRRRDTLCRGQDAAIIERDLEAGKSQTVSTASTFILEGWAREDQIAEVRKALDGVTDVYYLDLRDPEEGETPPTALKNKPLVAPYEAVTNLYSLPAYGSVDGTPLMAPFYFIFFGMMLSDTAYGLVLALGCWAFLKIMKPQPGMMQGIVKVLMQGGVSTMVMGLLFGTCAGVSWPVIFAGTPLASVFPLIDSGSEPMAMLGVCAGFGLIHMFYAVIIATKSCIRRGDWMGAIVDNFSWVVIIVGLLLLAAPMLGLPQALSTIGMVMAIGGAVVVFLFAGRAKGWKLGRFISGAGKLYDVTSWLSDVLSYARIFALGLSTGVIGLVLNTLCWDMLFAAFKGNVVLTIVGFVITTALSVALHLFMMAINTLGSFVHTARLQYVEFFGKFYDASGKPFRPLKYKTKHVVVHQK